MTSKLCWASQVVQWERICLPIQEMKEMQVQSLSREDPLDEKMVTHSSLLAWKIPWTKEPGRLQSIESLRVGHDLSTYIQGACHFAEEKTETWREGTPADLPHPGAGGSWPHQLIHHPITSREEPSARTTCPQPSPWKPCLGTPRMEWSMPSILPAHPPPNPPNSLVMYKTFPETAYSSCIFHEAGPTLKHTNIKISRSTLKKKKGHVS